MTIKAIDSLKTLEQSQVFAPRHLGIDDDAMQEMLACCDSQSLEDFTRSVVPGKIFLDQGLDLPDGVSEEDALATLKSYASQNSVHKSLIGLGYYNTIVPNVIARNVFENPAWYTAYTPYQPEIAQGRLEAIINFQQLTLDLTGLDLASASLLDEATAAAEAMALAKRVSKNKKASTFFIDEAVFPQTIDVVRTRAEALGYDVKVGAAETATEHDIFGALFQYPGKQGEVVDFSALFSTLKENKVIVACAADIMSLVLLESPAAMGADVVFGSAQRFGVPMGFGGPHAAFFATHDAYKRSLPGRVIGVSKDTQGNTAFRMAMQTREQHIRREKATSNICTAQVLLANMASFYAVYHGPKGLNAIAQRIHRLTSIFAAGLSEQGLEPINESWFDTLTFRVTEPADALLKRAEDAGYNLRLEADDIVSLSLDECTKRSDLSSLWQIFLPKATFSDIDTLDAKISGFKFPESCERQSAILTHPVFNRYHSETEMLRYIKKLESRDLSLVHAMIPLGSCTMKLNATAEMLPVSWPEFANIHPFVPAEQTKGYQLLIKDLIEQLKAITGYDEISMQPNSGAQGEYAGLLAIKNYHLSRGDSQRDICLIPSSAHGTNPASAQMAGFKVVVVACDKAGNIDLEDLTKKAQAAGEKLAALMVTYPSTHGVFEEQIMAVCDLVHEFGGQVYMDGANMNAQVGITQPAMIGSDVSHLNLHKTFCIPHGGGGPGMGPIGVKAHLAPFLPGHSVVKSDTLPEDQGAVSAAPWGSASILPISWMYIQMMGGSGLTRATQVALLSANYIAKRLSGYYPILYTGRNQRVAHECIIDLRGIKAETGVTEMDIAKRLMDFGFHAPTMSFPVPGTFMVEPTESESKAELDRFIDAMIAIHQEINEIKSGQLSYDQSPLHNAPHTLVDISDSEWSRAYTKQQAAFPSTAQLHNKFWPSVNRIDDVYGDRNFICACPAISEYDDSL